jgi:hypothetical protein
LKKSKTHSTQVSRKPKREELPWPGLKAKDRLARVVTREVKAAKEIRENKMWAEKQIARVLDYITPEAARNLVLRLARRRNVFPLS